MQQAKANSFSPEKIACGESLLRREGKGDSLWSAGQKGWNALWNCWKAKERRIAENEIKKIIIQSTARKEHRQGKVLSGVLGGQGEVVMNDKDFVDVNRELATHGADLKHLRDDIDRILTKLETLAGDIGGMKKMLDQNEGGWMFMLKVAAIAGAVVAVAKFLGA